MNTSEKLFQLRRTHGLSQEQAAERLGVSRQAISKWENGQSVPDTDKLSAISRLYGVSVDDLLSEDGDCSPESGKAPSRPGTPHRLGGGVVLCLLGATGLLLWAAVTVLAPNAARQMDASSAVTLRGTGLWAVGCLAAMVIGAVVLLRNRS